MLRDLVRSSDSGKGFDVVVSYSCLLRLMQIKDREESHHENKNDKWRRTRGAYSFFSWVHFSNCLYGNFNNWSKLDLCDLEFCVA